MPDRAAGCDGLGGGGYCLGVDPGMAVEIRQRPRLPELLDPERAGAMAPHGAEPGERRRVAVKHRHQAATLWHIR
jgi:hypothetical protein